MRKSICAAMALCGLLTASDAALAQSWPTRPVKIVAPWAAGGSASLMGRIVSDQLSRTLGQQFILDHQAGASGTIGSKAVAAAEPDGYTFVVSGIASHIIAPVISPTPPFDTMRDFTHVGYLGGPPFVLVVHPSLDVSSFKEFIALAKRTPEGLNYVSAGTGTHGHLMTEYLAKSGGIKLNHIPYRGSAPAMQDLLAGHVKVGGVAWSSAVEQVRAGTLRAIGVSSEQRIPDAPNVPTFKEMGFDNLVAATWFSVSGPAKLPKEITTAFNRNLVNVLQLPEVKTRFAQDAIEIKLMDPDQFTAFVRQEIARWTPIAKSIGPISN